MEDVPTVESVVEGEENESLLTDGLTFAVGEDDSGLNFAYIIHLPIDEMRQIIEEHHIPEQDSLNVETKHAPNIFSEESYPEMGNSSVVLPVSSSNSCDTLLEMTPLSPVTSNANASVSTRVSNLTVGSDAIEIQYLENGDFLHEGQKCEVENLIVEHDELSTNNEDVKCDPLMVNSSESENVADCGTFGDEPSDQENISTSLGLTVINEPPVIKEGETIVKVEEIIINKEEASGKEECNAQDILCVNETTSSEHSERPPTVTSNNLVATPSGEAVVKPIRTYRRKGLPPLPLKEDEKITPNTVQHATHVIPKPKSYESRPLTKIVRLAEVHVKKPQFISIPIPVKKRRLIVDTHKQIPIVEFKKQLVNTKDILHERGETAPSTKQAMKCLELGGVVHLFSSPGRCIPNFRLSRLFTNHLVVLTTNDDCCPETTNVAPLNADLRIPNSSENVNCDLNDQLNNHMPTTQPSNRLKNVGKPLVCQFKGLRKPPVFKEYKRMHRKQPTTQNGTKRIPQFSHKPINNLSKTLKEESTTEDSAVKIEEVVYTVEDENVVLKSCGIKTDHSPTSNEEHRCNREDDIVSDLVLIDSVTEEHVSESLEETNYDESILPSSEAVGEAEIEPIIEDTFNTSPVPVEFYNDSSDLDVKPSSSLHSEEDLKLWNYKVTSS